MMMRCVMLAVIVANSSARAEPKAAGKEGAMALSIHTSAFSNEGAIPRKHTGDGPDVSPPLEWSGAPPATKAYALIMDDPDAPVGTWVHWVIYDIPATQTSLPEGVPRTGELSTGARQGVNSWPTTGYRGPAPPPGKAHRYYFKLYALSAPTGLAAGADKAALEKAMQGKIVAQAQVMGRYGR